MALKINVNKWYGFTAKEKAIAEKGLAILENTLNSEKFKEAVLNAYFTSTKGMSNQQILDRILSGADCMDETVDYTLNLNFSMYYKWFTRVIGWVTPGTRMIHVNRKYFKNSISFASNALHEYAHMVGFDHSSATEYNSVPYKLNAIFEINYAKPS